MKFPANKLCYRLHAVFIWLILLSCFSAGAQPLNAPFLSMDFSEQDKPIRLSTWLSTQKIDESAYLLGTIWSTIEEKNNQQKQHQQLFEFLDKLNQSGEISKEEKNELQIILDLMKPTGRLLISGVNFRWLEANPRRDPLLLPSDHIEIPKRANSIRVMSTSGEICELPHQAITHVVNYVDACLGKASSPWVWIIQADGRVQKIGVRQWNQFEQVLPSPGSWIWAPDQDSLIPEVFHKQWTHWLSTQGVSERLPLDIFPKYKRMSPTYDLDHIYESKTHALVDKKYSSSNWGYVGLIQTPTARMQTPGNFVVSANYAFPQTHMNLFFQPLVRTELGIRYSDISNRKYGAASFSGDQTYKDKSMDLKIQLTDETDLMPASAVGWRDAAGTGLFSSEYLVGNKRFGIFDFSIGLAWGNMGSRADWRNPLSRVLGRSFDLRQNHNVGEGGNFSIQNWFHGPVALIGGLSYQSNWDTEFKVELDGNNYRHEPQNNNLSSTSPLNLMATYHWVKGVDFNLGIVRGNTLTVGVSLFTDLSRMSMPKTIDIPSVSPYTKSIEVVPDWKTTVLDIESQTQWDVNQISIDGKATTLIVDFENPKTVYPENRINKAVAVLNRDAPDHIDNFDFQFMSTGEVLATQSVNRNVWIQSQIQPARSSYGFSQPTLKYHSEELLDSTTLIKTDHHDLTFEPGIDLSYVLQGPDAFITYQIAGSLNTNAKLPYGWLLSSNTRLRLFGNDDEYKNTGSSQLPRVRTFVREYFVTSHFTIPSLTLSKTTRLSEHTYASTYLGYLEEMFGGVGTELLYRKSGSPWAVGLDMNYVIQREFSQHLQFRSYQVNTGHLTGYFQLPFSNLTSSLSVGQYLAGDKGVTLSISKFFNNGTSMGIFATKTNVSAAAFGEGSFDKGVYIKVPFDAFLPKSSLLSANFDWRPMTRDGGAKLNRPVSLLNETSWLDPMVYRNNRMASPPNEMSVPDDHVYE